MISIFVMDEANIKNKQIGTIDGKTSYLPYKFVFCFKENNSKKKRNGVTIDLLEIPLETCLKLVLLCYDNNTRVVPIFCSSFATLGNR